MRLHIVHESEYRYDADVFLEPHYLRFRPQATAYCRAESFALDIDPAPVSLRESLDEEGNVISLAWFEGLSPKLTIRAESVCVTEEYNPLGFIFFPPGFSELPPAYGETRVTALGYNLRHLPMTEALDGFALQAEHAAGGSTLPYLLGLTRAIHGHCTVVYREVGPPLPPGETFAGGQGSCRDLSWMMIAILRQRGFAARFVSGYFYFAMDTPSYELHAWVEAFVPGSGWFGLDPSHGIATGHAHVPLARSADHASTMPVSGSVRGTASSTLRTDLSIAVL